MEAGSIWIRLGLDSTGLTQGINNAKANLTQWRDETNANSRDMLKWGAAIGATVAPVLAVGYAVDSLIQKHGRMAQVLKDLSYQTGISTDQLQRYRYAAVLSGTDFSVVSMALNKLSLSMAEASDHSSDAYKAFMGLGVDPNGRTPDQVFQATTAALVEMKDETERNALTMAIYGKSWKELLPFMQTYIDKKKEINSISVLSKEELDANEKAKVQVDGLISRLETRAGQALANINMGLDATIGKWWAWEMSSEANVANQPYSPWVKKESQTIPEDQDPTLHNYNLAASVVHLTDKYKDLAGSAFDLAIAQDKVRDAQAKYDLALKGTDQDALNQAAINLHNAKDALADLKQKIDDAASASAKAARSIPRDWQTITGAMKATGSEGSAMSAYMQSQLDAGIGYDQALQNWTNFGEALAVNPGQNSKKLAGSVGTDNVSGVKDSFTDQVAAYTDGYTKIEDLSLTHYTALTELARIADQSIMDNWYKTAEYITNLVAYEQVITSENGVDTASPRVFSGAPPPTLAITDFSGVRLVSGGNQQKDQNQQQPAGTTAQQVSVTVVVPKETPSGTYQTTTTANRNAGAQYTARVV